MDTNDQSRSRGAKAAREDCVEGPLSVLSIIEEFRRSSDDLLVALVPVATYIGHSAPSPANVDDVMEAFRRRASSQEVVLFDSVVTVKRRSAEYAKACCDMRDAERGAQQHNGIGLQQTELGANRAKQLLDAARVGMASARKLLEDELFELEWLERSRIRALTKQLRFENAELQIRFAESNFVAIGVLKHRDVPNIAHYEGRFAALDTDDLARRFLRALVECARPMGTVVEPLVRHSVFLLKKLLGKETLAFADCAAGTITDAHTLLFWSALFNAAGCLMDERDRVDVVVADASPRCCFLGSDAQPSVSLMIPSSAPFRALSFVQSVVALRTDRHISSALQQVFKWRVRIGALRPKPIETFLCAVVDDESLNLVLCARPPVEDIVAGAGPNVQQVICSALEPSLIAKARIAKNNVVTLMAHLCAYMHAVRHASLAASVAAPSPPPPSSADVDDGAAGGGEEEPAAELEGEGEEEEVAVISYYEGTPTVSVKKKKKKVAEGGGVLVAEKVFPCRRDYLRERDIIETLSRCGLPALRGVEFNDLAPSITFKRVGHRVRINSGAQFAEALRQLEGEIGRLWAAQWYHGDISPRNLIMCYGDDDDSNGNTLCKESHSGSVLFSDVGADTMGDTMVATVVGALTGSNINKEEEGPCCCGQGATYHLIDFGAASATDSNNETYTEQTSFGLSACNHLCPLDFLARDLFALRVSLLILASESFAKIVPLPFPDINCGFGRYEEDFTDYRAAFLKSVSESDDSPRVCRDAAAVCTEIWKSRYSPSNAGGIAQSVIAAIGGAPKA